MRTTTLVAAVSGLAWSVIGYFAAAPFYDDAALAGAIAGPVIGLGVGSLHRRMAPRSLAEIAGVSLLTLFVAAAAFGGAAQVAAEAGFTQRAPSAVDVASRLGRILQAPLLSMWGLVFSGLVVPLWPMAALNHYVYDVIVDWSAEDRGTLHT
jgi:hypothetical protein